MTPRIEEVLGRRADELLGEPPWAFMPEVDRGPIEYWYRRVVSDGSSFRRVEQRCLHADGRIVWVHMHGVAIRDALGRVTGVRGAGQDVTERRRSQLSLEQAKEEAEAASRAKSSFLANMSHELRTPMTAILGFTELLQDSDITEEERARHTATIRRNGEHLLHVVNDILDLSKIEAGRFEIETCPIDLRTLVEDTIALLAVRADGKGIELDTNIAPQTPARIATDPVRLRQILVNLVGNALKFTEHGRVSIAVRPVEGESALEIVVQDTGIGIEPEHLQRLFEPFSQVDGSATRRFGGTGLGLSISSRLATLLGGGIEVESELGRGSRFVLRVAYEEVASQSAVGAAQASVSPQFSLGRDKLRGRVLLVEDGPDNQRLFGFVLRKAGLEVDIVDNGQAACDLLLPAEGDRGSDHPAETSGAYDLVLMDMQMPVMDGYAATRRLREHGFERPIVALTAHAMAGDREKCLDAGCDDFLTKPLDRQALFACLQERLGENVERVPSSD